MYSEGCCLKPLAEGLHWVAAHQLWVCVAVGVTGACGVTWCRAGPHRGAMGSLRSSSCCQTLWPALSLAWGQQHAAGAGRPHPPRGTNCYQTELLWRGFVRAAPARGATLTRSVCGAELCAGAKQPRQSWGRALPGCGWERGLGLPRGQGGGQEQPQGPGAASGPQLHCGVTRSVGY